MSAIIPCLFGTTKGFEMLELAHLNFKVKDLLVAITHAEVELGLEDSCVKILRIKAENRTHTWVGLYRKAYEMGFSREGGYYGAGVWLSDATVNARQIMDALEDLCQQIRRLALQDRKFQRTLADIEPQLVASPALNALLKGTPALVRGGINPDAKTCAFITQPQAVQDIINWAQTDAMAHNFQSIIVAPASAFPKAGASGSITQYADLPAVERVLERDYTARVAKLEGEKKDLQRKAQSLEAEASVRNSELQVLKQKNSQLAAEASRARLQAKTDSRNRIDDDESFLSEDLAKLVLGVLAVVSVLGNLALGWFWYSAQDQNDDYKRQITDLQGKYDGAGGELKITRSELSETTRRLGETRSQLAEAQIEIDKLRSEIDALNLDPGALEPKSKGKANGESSTPSENNNEATAPLPPKAPPRSGMDIPPQLPPEEENSASLGEMANTATNELELALLEFLAKNKTATLQDLSLYADEERLIFNDPITQVSKALQDLTASQDVTLKKKKYSLTDKGRKRLKGSVPK